MAALTCRIHYTLRIAVAMCFIGHGIFGIITKPVWANYFAVFGITHDLVYTLMPVVGTIDILLGIIVLIYPVRAIPAWLIFWGIMTALLRPLSGEPFAEFIERAGNFGAPLALLLLSGNIKQNIRNVLKPIDPNKGGNDNEMATLLICLRILVFLLLAGHGWLNIIEKKTLIDQYIALGFSEPAKISIIIGVFEMLGAFIVLIRPARPILLLLFAWKAASEAFYPHYGLVEWVERGGSYGCLLALLLATRNEIWQSAPKHHANTELSPTAL